MLKGKLPAHDLRRDIHRVREMLLTVHYFAESHWLTAAVEFPALCRSEAAQEALRHASAIAWQFGFPNVSRWLNTEVLLQDVQDVAPGQTQLAALIPADSDCTA